jgi:hypothetical protein
MVNILLPVSQHPFVFMLAIECYFLQKTKQNHQHNATENVYYSHICPSGILRSVHNPRKANFPLTSQRKPEVTHVLTF